MISKEKERDEIQIMKNRQVIFEMTVQDLSNNGFMEIIQLQTISFSGVMSWLRIHRLGTKSFSM